MAAGATIHTFTLALADMDAGTYEDLELRVARHPSESPEYLLTRLLAYCLEFTEGIEFTAGISSVDEPAILVKDLTGHIVAWIEVGAPDVSRLHFGSKRADRAAVWTHREPTRLVAGWAGKPLHRAEQIPVNSFDEGFIDQLVPLLARRNQMTVTRTEGELYIDLNGTSVSSAVHTTTAG